MTKPMPTMEEAYDASSKRIQNAQDELRNNPALTDEQREQYKRTITYEMAVWN